MSKNIDIEITESSIVSNIVTINYRISYYRKSKNRLAIVFSSAGKWGAGEPIEEFKNTITKTGVSVIFIVCKGIEWYNNEETPDIIELIYDIAKDYDHCCALGESMGAFGALMMASHCPHISRVLAFSPQFSIKPPFINFDERYRDFGYALKNHIHGDCANDLLRDRAVTIFGRKEYLDYFHASMFRAHGIPVVEVADADHMVARFLKNSLTGNLLFPLIELLCDFSRSFAADTVTDLLDLVVVSNKSSHPLNDDSELKLREEMLCKRSQSNVALGKTARQSSTSQWSSPPYTDTASVAVAKFFNPDCSFHTDFEYEPWWQVDLETETPVREIQIYNRRANADRLIRFAITISLDGITWKEIHRKDDDLLIVDSLNPYVWVSSSPVPSRFVKIALIGQGILHLSRVRILI
jgi:hypothetical protein